MPKNYAYTDLSLDDSLRLEIEGTRYEVSQFNASWAINEVPLAQCLLAVGRDFATRQPAKVHTAHQYKQMTPAKVTFRPAGEYRPDGTKWPGEQVIFEGYFVGFAYRKVMGKITVVANLVHLLADLGCSSALAGNGHVANPTQLNVAAVLDSLDGSGAGKGNYISLLAPAQLVENDVATDFWKAVKTIFCKLAARKTQPCGPKGDCGGGGTYSANTRGLNALKRIEIDTDDCPFDPADGGPTYAVPLLMDTQGVDIVNKTLAYALSNELIESYASVSFWDKLVTQICPMVGMAVVPCARRALVVADTPCYNGGVWKTIEHTEYDSCDFPATLERPLRGVGVVAMYESETAAGIMERPAGLPIIGGCYVEDSVEAGDGLIQFIASPPWLRMAHTVGAYAGDTTGGGGPSRAAGADAPGKQPRELTPESFGQSVNALYQAYAHDFYVKNMLRGRTGSLSGKLRFDIAPGSIVKVVAKADVVIGAEDDLAFNLYGCVSRVTVSINAEAGMAGTTFVMTHLRTEDENQSPRTSVDRHPLFDKSIHGGGKHGCPLVPKYDL